MADIFEIDQTTDPNKDYLTELVGEGKKFKDPQSLARGKYEGDLHNKRLEAENADLRNELKTRVNMETVLDQIKTFAPKPDADPPAETHTTAPNEKNAITPEELEAVFSKMISEREKGSVAKQNYSIAQEAIVKAFGSEETASSEVARKATELGISVLKLKEMAQDAPKAFIALMTAGKPQTVSPPRTGVNAAGVNFQPTGARTQASWEDMRKRDPVSYHSKQETIKRHNDAIRLGEAFFDL